MSTSKFYLLLLFFEAIRILNFFFCKVLKALWESEKLEHSILHLYENVLLKQVAARIWKTEATKD